MSGVDYVIRILGENKDAKEKLEGIGKVAVAVGATIAAAAIGAAFATSLTNAIDMADAEAKIVAGLGLTEEQSAEIGGVAGSLYADAYGESVADVSTAVESVVSSIDGMRNASSEAVEATTAKLINLETALGIDVARSAQVAGQAVKAGLAENADQAIDLLVSNLQKVPANLREDLLDAVDEYGPVLANLGFTGEEAFGMLAAAADKGMYGIDKTGDSIKEFSINVGTDIARAGPLLERLGMDVEGTMSRVAGGGAEARAALEEVTQGILGIEDPGQRAAAAIEAFGAPIEDLGVTDIPAFLDTLIQAKDGFGDATGAADAMGETLSGSPKVAWEQLGRTWESIIGVLGESVLPILETVMGFLNENPAILTAVAIALGVVAVAFLAVAAAMWVASLTPISLIIAAIIIGIGLLIAIIVALVMNWDAVVAWIVTVWSGFMGWITGVIEGFVGWWNGIWTEFGNFISDIWRNLVLGIQFYLSLITSAVQIAIGWVMGIWNGFGTALSTAWNAIWDGILNVLKGIWNGILGVIEGGVNGAINLINGIIKGINGVAAVVGVEIGVIPNIKIPRLAMGGVTTGPTLALVGDNPGGREVVQPLASYQDELRRAYTAGQNSDGENGKRVVVEQHIHPTPKMSEEQVGRIAGERVGFALRGA